MTLKSRSLEKIRIVLCKTMDQFLPQCMYQKNPSITYGFLKNVTKTSNLDASAGRDEGDNNTSS